MSGKIRFVSVHGKPTDTGYIALTDVLVDDAFRCREQEDADAIEAYAEVFIKHIKAVKHSEKVRCEQLRSIDHLEYPFPPAWVWQEDGLYYLIAGHHRYQAATKAGLDRIKVKEFHGTKDEALLFAMKDNLKNAVRMSYGDWKYCISKALRLFPDKTPGAVAKELGCHRSYAYKIEKELSTSRQLPSVEERVGADGRKRSVKRKVKQPAVAPMDDITVSDQQAIENLETMVEQNDPAPQEDSIELPSPELIEKMDRMESYCRKMIRGCCQMNDRSYIIRRVGELLKKMEIDSVASFPQ